jgi:hypothetical protein
VTQLGSSGSGGNAYGGGIEVNAAAVLVATSGTVSQNDAEGGAVGDGIEGANTKLGRDRRRGLPRWAGLVRHPRIHHQR